MKKKSSYYLRFKTKNKTFRDFKIFIYLFCFFICLFSLVKIFKFVNKVFLVKEVIILENNTTIPDDLIKDFFLSNKIQVFNLRKNIKRLIDKYSEIKNVRVTNIPFKKLEIKIQSHQPIFYTFQNDKKFFICDELKIYSLFDEKKITQKVIEVETPRSYDLGILKSFVELLKDGYVKENIEKLLIKENGDCIAFLVNGKKIILNTQIISKKEDLKKIIDFILKNNVDVYAKLLDEGIVYFSSN